MHYLHVTKKLLSDHQAAALLAPRGSFTQHLIVSLYKLFSPANVAAFCESFGFNWVGSSATNLRVTEEDCTGQIPCPALHHRST